MSHFLRHSVPWAFSRGVFVIGITLLALGCGDANSQANGQTCDMPGGKTEADSVPGACTIDRAYVTCEGPSGGCSCLSEDRAGCAECSPTLYPSCSNLCRANEYAATCGFGGQTPTDPPAATCRFESGLPSGTAIYCCPCG